MKHKILIFLLIPLCIFATEEIAMGPANKKQQAKEIVVKKKALAREEISKPSLEKEELEEDLPNSAARSPAFVDSGYQKKFLTTLVFICILILFSLIVIYIYRKGAPMSKITKRNNRNNIKILERRSLSPQTYLYHVQVGDKQFILSESKVDVRNVTNLNIETSE